MNSYTSGNILMIHKPKCENNNLTTTRSSSESHLHWKDHFHENPLFFRIFPGFEADNEIEDNKDVCNKTTDICKENPVYNRFYIISQLYGVLQTGYYIFLLGYDNVDWFDEEVIKLESKMAFSFKNTNKDIILTQED